MEKILNSDRPPDHLCPEAKQMWKEFNAEIELPVDSLLNLRVAFENFCIAQEARQILKKEGFVIVSKNGMQRKHPCCEILKSATGQYLAAMRLLGLDRKE